MIVRRGGYCVSVGDLVFEREMFACACFVFGVGWCGRVQIGMSCVCICNYIIALSF
jgi:hypothetical protein